MRPENIVYMFAMLVHLKRLGTKKLENPNSIGFATLFHLCLVTLTLVPLDLNTKPPVGFEPTTSRLLSGCSAN
jgi:hypothetical protein